MSNSNCDTCDCMYPCRQAYQSARSAEYERRGYGQHKIECGELSFLSIGSIPPIESQCSQCGAQINERCRVVSRSKPYRTAYKFHSGRGAFWTGDYSDIETRRILKRGKLWDVDVIRCYLYNTECQ